MSQRITIRASQLGLAFMFFLEAAKQGLVEDAHRTAADIHKELNYNISISVNLLESIVALARELDLKKKFKHPNGLNFELWVRFLLGKDYEYNPADGGIRKRRMK